MRTVFTTALLSVCTTNPIADLQKQNRYNTNTNYFISSYLFLTDRLWLHEIVQTPELTYQDYRITVLFHN